MLAYHEPPWQRFPCPQSNPRFANYASEGNRQLNLEAESSKKQAGAGGRSRSSRQQQEVTPSTKHKVQSTKSKDPRPKAKDHLSSMNFKLTIQYDGTDFHGWQMQAQLRTVQGELTRALSRIDGRDVVLHGSGRTDAGVHAEGQVANVHLEKQIAPETLRA